MFKKISVGRPTTAGILALALTGCGGTGGAAIDGSAVTIEPAPTTTVSAGYDCDMVYTNTTPLATVGQDPLRDSQWNLRNTGQSGGSAGQDIRLDGAWEITRGAGVTVAVLDDSVELFHPDLYGAFVPGGSKSYRSGNRSGLPLPCKRATDTHGTWVAGIIAAQSNNGVGGVGVAPEAKLVAYDVLSGRTPTNFFDALTRDSGRVSIYNNSWSSTGGGAVRPVFGLFDEAISLGIDYGRGTLGSIYVFAAGNGGQYDNSNLDGFLTGRGVIAVCQVDENGRKAPTSEPGANLLLCAPGSRTRGGVTTTAIGGGYTQNFSGTSAAAPTVSGVVALMLSARPDLTWRDVQLILAKTARKNQPGDPDWRAAAGGSGWVHPFYGYGVIDATAAVRLAQTWQTVGGSTALRRCESAVQAVDGAIPDGAGSLSAAITLSCPGITKIEHAEVAVTIQHENTGDMRIDLTTAAGATSRLVDARRCTTLSKDPCGTYSGWKFGLKHHLDENPSGTWTLQISDLVRGNVGSLQQWQVIVYGR